MGALLGEQGSALYIEGPSVRDVAKVRSRGMQTTKPRGIEVKTSTRVTRVLDGSVEINGNETLAACTVIWTAGVRASELIESLPGPHDRIGRAVVNAHLQLEGYPEVFVIGDSAAAVNAQCRKIDPSPTSHYPDDTR